MNTFLKILSLMLAVIMLAACFVGCTDDPDEGKDTSKDSSSANPSPDGSGTPAPEEVGLPQKDWGGADYTVLGRDGNGHPQFDSFEIAYDELPADVVGQAVYQRNDLIKSKYNFNVNRIWSTDVFATAQNCYNSGDDLYTLVIYRPDMVQSHAQQGYLIDLNDEELKYINFDNPTWYPEVNEELTIGNQLYYTTNNFLLQDKHRLWYCFYNRDLAADLGLGYFEDMVDNNTWTLENVSQLVKSSYAELDGVSGKSAGDRYGLAYTAHFTFAVFAFSAGLRLTEKDANGYPVLVGATDSMMRVIDNVFKLTEGEGVWREVVNNVGGDATGHAENMFNNGQVVLLQAFTSFIDYFLSSDRGFSYGALPNPKVDADQENYGVFPNVGNSSFFSIPYTVTDKEFAGYALEAISEESTDTSYTAYIDIKCKYQDAYDEDCARMFDLCFRSAVYDLGTYCNFGELFTSLYSGQGSGLAGIGRNFYQRYFDTAKVAAQADIDALIAEYESRT